MHTDVATFSRSIKGSAGLYRFYHNQKLKTMACEICGRNLYTRSFHNLEEQSTFDDVADSVKNRMKDVLKRQIERLKDYGNDDSRTLVDIEEVIEIIESYP